MQAESNIYINKKKYRKHHKNKTTTQFNDSMWLGEEISLWWNSIQHWHSRKIGPKIDPS